MRQAFIIGPVFLDIITSPLARFPAPGEEQYIESLDISPGGFAITALTLARLGVASSLISVLGADQFGGMLSEKISGGGVDASFLITSRTAPTSVSIAFPQAGDRSFLTRAMREEDFLHGILDALHSVPRERVSHMHLNISMLRNPELSGFVKECRARGATVSLDLGWEEAQRWSADDWGLAALADIFKPNETEALRITGAADIPAALKVMRAHCPRPVITLGAKGSVGLDDDGKPVFAQPYRVEPKNAVGAGDAFTAGYLYAYLKGMPAADCLRYGNAAGALTAGSRLSAAEDMGVDRLLAVMNGEGAI